MDITPRFLLQRSLLLLEVVLRLLLLEAEDQLLLEVGEAQRVLGDLREELRRVLPHPGVVLRLLVIAMTFVVGGQDEEDLQRASM